MNSAAAGGIPAQMQQAILMYHQQGVDGWFNKTCPDPGKMFSICKKARLAASS